jgi:hypothetical protein
MMSFDLVSFPPYISIQLASGHASSSLRNGKPSHVVTPPLPGLENLPTYLGGAEQSSSRVELSCPHPSRLELMQVRVSAWWPTEPRFNANNTSVKVWPCEPYSNLKLGSANETLRYFWSKSGFNSRTLAFSCMWLDSRCSPVRWPL